MKATLSGLGRQVRDELGGMAAKVAALEAENAELRAVVGRFLQRDDPDGKPCRTSAARVCWEHDHDTPCPVGLAKAALGGKG